MFPELVIAGLLQGLILAIVSVGIVITFRLLNLQDLTAEGSYTCGGAISAALLLLNLNPIIVVIIAAITGGIIGSATSLLHLRFNVNPLLGGIIIITILYSINLHLMGKPNIALFECNTLFSAMKDSVSLKLGLLVLICTLISVPVIVFLHTEYGLCLRAVGLNNNFAKLQNIGYNKYTFLGLCLSNAISGIAGSIMVQFQAYADINMGLGIVIHALAALMIGEAIIGTQTIIKQLTAPVIGAVIYQQIQGLVLMLGLAPFDLKLFTGLTVLGIIVLRNKV